MDETDKLKQENEQLKLIIKSLREQIENLKKRFRKQHNYETDYIPYHEDERR